MSASVQISSESIPGCNKSTGLCYPPGQGRRHLLALCVPNTITIPDRNNFIANENELVEGALSIYLSRFSVFNENSCGNSASIKQVKEKQENNIRGGLLYLERRLYNEES